MMLNSAIRKVSERHDITLIDSGYSDGSYHGEWWKCKECNVSFLLEYWGPDWGFEEISISLLDGKNNLDRMLIRKVEHIDTLIVPTCNELTIKSIIE